MMHSLTPRRFCHDKPASAVAACTQLRCASLHHRDHNDYLHCCRRVDNSGWQCRGQWHAVAGAHVRHHGGHRRRLGGRRQQQQHCDTVSRQPGAPARACPAGCGAAAAAIGAAAAARAAHSHAWSCEWRSSASCWRRHAKWPAGDAAGWCWTAQWTARPAGSAVCRQQEEWLWDNKPCQSEVPIRCCAAAAARLVGLRQPRGRRASSLRRQPGDADKSSRRCWCELCLFCLLNHAVHTMPWTTTGTTVGTCLISCKDLSQQPAYAHVAGNSAADVPQPVGRLPSLKALFTRAANSGTVASPQSPSEVVLASGGTATRAPQSPATQSAQQASLPAAAGGTCTAGWAAPDGQTSLLVEGLSCQRNFRRLGSSHQLARLQAPAAALASAAGGSAAADGHVLAACQDGFLRLIDCREGHQVLHCAC